MEKFVPTFGRLLIDDYHEFRCVHDVQIE
jgi:hypothetical protein